MLSDDAATAAALAAVRGTCDDAERLCLLLDEQGAFRRRWWRQSALHSVLGGVVTLAGMLDDSTIIVALREPSADARASPLWRAAPHLFFREGDVPVRGSLVLVAIDDEGESTDVDVETVVEHLEGNIDVPDGSDEKGDVCYRLAEARDGGGRDGAGAGVGGGAGLPGRGPATKAPARPPGAPW